MESKPRSGDSRPLKPVPPPKPKSASNDVTRKIEDLTAKFTHLEEKTSLQYVDMQKKNNQLLEEISHLRSHITTLQRDHTSLQHNHAELQKEHQVLYQKLAGLNLYLKTFQTELNKALSDQSSLKEEQEKLKTEVHRMESDQHTLRSKVETMPIQQADVQSSTDNVASLSHYHAGVEDVTVTQPVALMCRDQSQLSQLQTDHNQLQTDHNQLRADHNQLQTDHNQLRTDHSQLQTDHSQLQTDHSQLQTDHSQLRTDHSQWEAHIARLQTAQTELATSHNNMRGEMETSCSAIKELKTTMRKTRTLFYASELNEDQSDHCKAMVFNTITTNEGGHYDARSGVFTTPYAGLYIFTATLVTTSTFLYPFMYIHIIVDGTVVRIVPGGVHGGSACVPLSLEPGQKVWLKPHDTIKNNMFTNIYGSFSGTLALMFP